MEELLAEASFLWLAGEGRKGGKLACLGWLLIPRSSWRRRERG